MKKSLLLAAAAILAAPATFAGIDNATYPEVDGLSIVNLWNVSRNLDNNEFMANPFGELSNKIRSTVVVGDKLVCAYSRTMVEGEESNDYAHLLIYDLQTGLNPKLVQLTVNGQPISGLLCANQIGVDDFGHVWFTGLLGDSDTKPFILYLIKDINTGVCEVAATLQVPEGEASGKGRRHDYSDLVGDITGEKAGAVFLSPAARDESNTVIGFRREMGSNEWTPAMNGGEYTVGVIDDTYPAGAAGWDGAPMVRIIREDTHSGDLFYIDAFVTAPALYNGDCALLDSFANAPELAPKNNCNGCTEFSLNGQDYFVYTVADYDTGVGSQVRIVRFGEGQTFEGMKLMWDVPANGFGTISDSGTRMFGINPVTIKDAQGHEAILLALAKCNNGLGVYRIAGKDFNAGVSDIIADDSDAPVRYYTPAGIEVSADALIPGLYITRQGTRSSKTVIR